MATPPPLSQAPGPGLNPQPVMPPRPPKKNSSKIWLIVGACVAGVAAIVAILLFILSDLKSTEYEYDDGNRHEKPLRQRDDDEDISDKMTMLTDNSFEEPEEEIVEEVAMPTAQGPVALHGIGVNTNSAISMDIDIDDNGNVSGTYWNILYHLKFKVTGSEYGTTDVNHLDLTLSIDGVNTPLYLSSTDGVNYTGTWGAKNKPVSITLNRGHFSADASPGATVSEGHISGNGLNRDFRISYGPGGDMYYWYPSQNFNNRLKIVDNGGGSFTIFRRDGGYQASITLNNSGSGTLQDTSNRTFTIKMY